MRRGVPSLRPRSATTGSPSAAPTADGGVTVPADPMADRPVTTFSPLRVREYRRMWLAQVVSQLGNFLQLTAGPWLMFEMTRSAFWTSLVTTALLLPRLVLTLPAGALGDVIGRRKVLIAGNVLASVAGASMAVVAVLDLIGPALLLGFVVLLGSGAAIAQPAFQTLVPDLVPRRMLPQAVTLNSGAFNVARAVGPAIGGVLVAAGLAAVSFTLTSLSFLVVVAATLTLPSEHVEVAPGERRHLLRATVVGLRYARFTPTIRMLLLITAGFTFGAASVQALMAPAAAEIGLGGTGFGLLWGILGVGAVVGVWLRERARLLLSRRMVSGSILIYGAAGVLFGLSGHPIVAGAALFIAGMAWVWVFTTINATIQLLAPRWVRSRVVGLYALVVGLQPIGAFFAGALASVIGSGNSVAVTTALLALLGIYTNRLDIPMLGRLREPELADVEVPEAHLEVQVSGPVVVSRTWMVRPEDVDEFLDVMRQARRVRRRTGARTWRLHRDPLEAGRFIEHVSYAAWDEQIAQRGRLDASDLAVLRRARELDVDGGPRTRHLTEMDL